MTTEKEKAVEFVDYRDLLGEKISSFLLSKELAIANTSGMAWQCSRASNSAVGILYKDPDEKPLKYLFGLITREPRRRFLGTIWFMNDARGANGQNWVFEVHGRKYVELAKKLAEEMSSDFGAKITLRLESEWPEVERISSDFMFMFD